MGLTAKILIIVTFMAMLVSGIIGAYLYYSYVSPVERLADTGKLSLEEVLDKVSYIEYKETVNESTYIFKVSNNPGDNTGLIEAYTGNGTLLYKLEYKYNGDLLSEVYKIYPNGSREEVNPRVYEPDFKTSIHLRVAGRSANVSPSAGVGPVYMIYYLTDELDIDWKAATSPRGGVISQVVSINIIPGEVDFLGERVRGTILSITPVNPLFSPTIWGMPEYSIYLANLDGIVVSPKYRMVLTLQAGEYIVDVELVNIQLAEG